MRRLKQCAVNEQHIFYAHLNTCPWCERKTLLGGSDPFPSVREVRRKLGLPDPMEQAELPRADDLLRSRATPVAPTPPAGRTVSPPVVSNPSPVPSVSAPSIVLSAAEVLRLPAPRTIAEYTSQMAVIPGGTFQMGSNDYHNERPVHSVTLSGFRMGRTPVTVAMWKEYCQATGTRMPSAPSWGWLDDHPMVNVSWEDARAYCDWATKQLGVTISLPTEAQWEYAGRGGRAVKYPWGNDWDADKLIWDKTSGGKTGAVYRDSHVYVNGYGLVDMAGNVWQWCADWYGSYSANAATNPVGASGWTWRVLRGGSWVNDYPYYFRASDRNYIDPSYRNIYSGFRAVAGLR